MSLYLQKNFIPKTTFLLFIFLSFLVVKLSSADAAVTKDWCFDTKFGHMPGNHPLPGIKNSFDTCPGKLLKKLPFEKVESHFSSGEGKQHVCNLIEGSSPSNERLKVWFELAEHLKLVCVDKAKEREKKLQEELARQKKLAQEREKKLQEEIALQKKLAEEKELAAKKRAEEEKKQKELAAKKKAEEEKNQKELAAKKRAEEKRQKELAAKKKAEEKRQKRLAEEKKIKEEQAKAKKKAEQLALNKKISENKRKALNFYKDIEKFVKSGGDVDLVALSDYYEVKPSPNEKWDNTKLSNYQKLRSFMTSIPQFVEFERKAIAERLKETFALKDKSIAELNNNLKELNGLMRKMFGSNEIPIIKNLIKDIQSVLSDFNQATADKVLIKSADYIWYRTGKPRNEKEKKQRELAAKKKVEEAKRQKELAGKKKAEEEKRQKELAAKKKAEEKAKKERERLALIEKEKKLKAEKARAKNSFDAQKYAKELFAKESFKAGNCIGALNKLIQIKYPLPRVEENKFAKIYKKYLPVAKSALKQSQKIIKRENKCFEKKMVPGSNLFVYPNINGKRISLNGPGQISCFDSKFTGEFWAGNMYATTVLPNYSDKYSYAYIACSYPVLR